MITYLSTLRPSLTFTGIDLSSAMLDRARVAHPTAVFVEGDLAALPFDDEHFDAVLAWYSIIHTPPQAALHEAGLMTHTLVDRSARPTERHAQGFVLAKRP